MNKFTASLTTSFRENDLNRLESLMDGNIEDGKINRKPF